MTKASFTKRQLDILGIIYLTANYLTLRILTSARIIKGKRENNKLEL